MQSSNKGYIRNILNRVTVLIAEKDLILWDQIAFDLDNSTDEFVRGDCMQALNKIDYTIINTGRQVVVEYDTDRKYIVEVTYKDWKYSANAKWLAGMPPISRDWSSAELAVDVFKDLVHRHDCY